MAEVNDFQALCDYQAFQSFIQRAVALSASARPDKLEVVTGCHQTNPIVCY
jgi:hypothetical protein